ncbi:MAG: cation:proton antiporter [Firmicutes bacterium]|nr:cation:proton antiporter [Bacillota bacterium]MDY3092342.1 cation:proton antiporter [Erysipelotrichaceae bacterium]
MDALLSLAIILLTGLIFEKIIRLFKLPNVTGYLIGGLLIGPSVLNLVTEGQLESLSFVSSIALGFIAFSIGGEFKMSYFKRVGLTPIIIAIFESLMAVFMVTGTLILFGFDKAFSIVLGAIAAATAPAATIMVIKQYKAKGSLTETLLSVVALDDAVALIAFGVAVAISQMINNPSGANLLSQIASPVIEILMSLVIGGILGFLLVLPVRFYKDDASRQSLIYIFIFIALYIASKGGYSDLLTIMAMGAVFTNLSNESLKLMRIADVMTPPIFMAFFVISGADLKLSILPSIGLVGIIYVVIRSVGKVLGASIGAILSKSDANIRKYLGFALLPQAGVAIGLTVVAKTVVPQYAETIRAVILCGTLIYELIGPAVSKWALTKAGDIK